MLADTSLREISDLAWQRDAPWFGGFSAIEVEDGGARATLVTDRGTLVRVGLQREQGKLLGVDILSHLVLRDQAGTRLRGAARDAEGLARARNGQFYVSVEFEHHVARLDPDTGRTERLPRHPDFDSYSGNSGLEALAIHPDGRLFAMAERGADRDGTIPLYAFDNGRWRIAHRLESSGGHVPVGADFDDAGRLFLLERLFTPLGFSTRIRLVTLGPGQGTSRTLLITVPGTYGNLEGISVWTDRTGQTRLTLVADNNFLPIQRTQIVEFILDE